MNQPVYLKQNLIVEPLINQWYAWSYLIAPATAAMYIAHSHIPIMESFIAAPQVHRDALKNSAMMGGPFINYDVDKVGEIQELLVKTQAEQLQLLNLATAIQDLEALLTKHHRGESLEPLYSEIPPALRGFVELVQDSNHHPSIRYLEGLLYRSYYYHPQNQSLNLYLGNPDNRSFVLSTPRLPKPENLHLQIPFADNRLDTLFSLRSRSLSYSEIREIFAIDSYQEELFQSFFTTTPPQIAPTYTDDKIRVRYFGHACILIETKITNSTAEKTISILCDPLISYLHTSHFQRYSYTDLPAVIDYVLITHNHQDHVMLETLLQLRHKIKTIIVPKSNKGLLIDPSLKLMLQQIGFQDVREVDDLEIINIPDGYIAALPFLGEHGDLNIGAKAAFLVNLKGRSLLCAADSNNIDNQLYTHLQQIFGNLDVLFIGMECDGAPYNWAYGALLTQQVPRKIAQTRRLDGSNSQRAIALVNQLNPHQVYVYAMGQEPWLTFITSIHYTETSQPIIESNQLVNYCRDRGIMSKRLFGCEEIYLEPNIYPDIHQYSHHQRFLKTISSPESATVLNINSEKFSYQKNNHEHTLHQQQGSLPPVSEFLSELQRLDIRVWLDETSTEPKLRCNAPKGVLTSELKEKLQQYKPDIIAFLANSNQTQVNINWEAEAVLDQDIFPDPSLDINQDININNVCIKIQSNTNILLTGATGFLGAFLLDELLQKTSAYIYCLVRAENTDAALVRIRKSLESYNLWDTTFATRIIPIAGDLTQVNLGISTEQFQTLAQQIDIIYHNGARVNHTDPYTRLKSSNVFGTKEILRLASLSKLKPVNFISTISVFGNSQIVDSKNLDNNINNKTNLVLEDDNLDDYPVPSAGYAQSKWVAEKIIIEARKRKIPVNIYRIGAITGDSRTGAFNQDDFLYNSLIGYVQMGAIPEGNLPLRLLPVNYVSQAIVTLSTQSQNQSFHLIQNQVITSSLILTELQKLGYPIQKLSYEQWRQKLLEIAQNSPDHILYPLVSLFPRPRPQNKQKNQTIIPLEFCDRNTQKILKGILKSPPIDSKLIQTYLQYLIQHQYIPAPVKI